MVWDEARLRVSARGGCAFRHQDGGQVGAKVKVEWETNVIPDPGLPKVRLVSESIKCPENISA